MNCPHCNTHIDEHPASRCLDAWVAEDVMGRVVPDIDFCGRREWALIVENDGIERLPDYSGSIAAAWEVVEKTGGFWTIQGYLYEGRTKRYYAGRRGNKGNSASTAPLAICRAAIKASA